MATLQIKINFHTFLTSASQTTQFITVCCPYSLQLRISTGLADVRRPVSDVTYAVDLASRNGGYQFTVSHTVSRTAASEVKLLDVWANNDRSSPFYRNI